MIDPEQTGDQSEMNNSWDHNDENVLALFAEDAVVVGKDDRVNDFEGSVVDTEPSGGQGAKSANPKRRSWRKGVSIAPGLPGHRDQAPTVRGKQLSDARDQHRFDVCLPIDEAFQQEHRRNMARLGRPVTKGDPESHKNQSTTPKKGI